MAKGLVIHRCDEGPRIGVNAHYQRRVSYDGVDFGAVIRSDYPDETTWVFILDNDDDLPRNLRELEWEDESYEHLRQIRAELESLIRDRRIS